ncbi:MAG: hypothetical protein M0R22_00345 [Dehalococcoidia bacterium]|jgi:hypothetical protein|nr:hypothetical protein [Dehalococcoidia bacterium]
MTGKKKITTTTSSTAQASGHVFDELSAAVQQRFRGARALPLFTTDASGLFDAFIAGLPLGHRQHHACNNCRHFVERYGGLVTIDAAGKPRSALWDSENAPEFYKAAVAAMEKRVARAAVTGIFYSEEPTWGVPQNVSSKTGITWTHFHALSVQVFKKTVLKNAAQAMAERREECGMLKRGLAEFSKDTALQALTLLKSGNLPRSEKALGVAEWFFGLHERTKGVRGKARDNIVWAAVATAPVGFAHVRASMIGTLLEDVQTGLPFEDIKAKWSEKMDPLQYMRPQSDPSAGNIAQAEKVVEALRSAGALERRFARLDEVQALWRPQAPPVDATRAGGVFANVKPKGSERSAGGVAQPDVVMTWEKFSREVLPHAREMFADVPRVGKFMALLTAVNPDAPPIIQWDWEAHRNPVNWYVYPGGSPAANWGLVGGGCVKVTAVCLLPCMWNPDVYHVGQGKGAVLLLEGCRESTFTGGIALFPEVLKSAYHAVRKTIEAFSRGAQLQGREEMSACGLDLRAGEPHPWNQRVHVIDEHGTRTAYSLDRWD